MRYLADTHILIWALSDSPKLSDKARAILLDADNMIYYSIVNIWEVSIKYMLHRESFVFSAEDFYNLCVRSGYEMLNLTVDHIFTTESLTRSENVPRHKDPFDRLLLAQAKAEKMLLLSHDTLLTGYNEPFLVNV